MAAFMLNFIIKIHYCEHETENEKKSVKGMKNFDLVFPVGVRFHYKLSWEMKKEKKKYENVAQLGKHYCNQYMGNFTHIHHVLYVI